MLGLIKALGAVKTATAIAALTAAAAITTQVALPAAATLGSANASHATHASVPSDAPAAPAADPSTGKDVAALQARLEENQARLIQHLNAVLARLQANANVNEHALAALQNVIDRLENGGTGLTRAGQAVAGGGAPDAVPAPSLPDQATTPTLPAVAQDHPTPSDHPGKP